MLWERGGSFFHMGKSSSRPYSSGEYIVGSPPVKAIDGWVDVRNVSSAHVLTLETSAVADTRVIPSAGVSVSKDVSGAAGSRMFDGMDMIVTGQDVVNGEPRGQKR
jgi:hypothetical protein